MTDTAPYQGKVPWHEFLNWEPDGDGGRFVVNVGDFELSVFYEDDAYDSAPGPAWHYEVRYQGIVACQGFSLRATDDGAVACIRTATKMAAFHGMELPAEIAPRVAHLLVDPHGVPDPANPGKRKPARRVALHGHKPSALARAAATADPVAEKD